VCYTGCQRKLVASSVCVSSGEWSCWKRCLSEMAGVVEDGIGNYPGYPNDRALNP